MGELEKEKGSWGYVEGGMGGVPQSIARSARSLGADIFTNTVSIQEEGVTIFLQPLFPSLSRSFNTNNCLIDIKYVLRMLNKSLLVRMVLLRV